MTATGQLSLNSVINFVCFISYIVINEYGKNVEALSRALPGKNISQCRNFFTNYKRKLNLPRLIAEYELKHVSR